VCGCVLVCVGVCVCVCVCVYVCMCGTKTQLVLFILKGSHGST